MVHERINLPLSGAGLLPVCLRDVARIDTIAGSGVMQEWARRNEFRLHGVDIRERISLIMKDALTIADEELDLPCPLERECRRHPGWHQQQDLPDFTVETHSSFPKMRIISWFDDVEPDSDEVFITQLRRAI